MLRRHASSVFAAGMFVFPGGAVEECDCEEGTAGLCAGIGLQEAASIIADAPSPEQALGLFVAGVRETFEEAGILLACEASGKLLSYRGEGAARFAARREAIRDGEITFREMILRENLSLALDRLVYFAHWITPELSPIRFDTRFFLAPAPPGQGAFHDDIETTAHVWIAPREALARNEKGALAMLPPTMVNLMNLARFSSVEDALASSVGRDIPVVAPQVSFEGGRMRLLLPADPDSP
ncbi:MAG: NUDIX hydrolase [Actinobacteria bacterium]|nr:MAG: NUDIX hydrolase [Actinomycetota bacterium]